MKALVVERARRGSPRCRTCPSRSAATARRCSRSWRRLSTRSTSRSPRASSSPARRRSPTSSARRESAACSSRTPTPQGPWSGPGMQGLGVSRDGCLAERAVVRDALVVPVPGGGRSGTRGRLRHRGRVRLAAADLCARPCARARQSSSSARPARSARSRCRRRSMLGAGRVVAAGRRPDALARAKELGADAVVRLDEADDLARRLPGGLRGSRPVARHRSPLGRAARGCARGGGAVRPRRPDRPVGGRRRRRSRPAWCAGSRSTSSATRPSPSSTTCSPAGTESSSSTPLPGGSGSTSSACRSRRQSRPGGDSAKEPTRSSSCVPERPRDGGRLCARLRGGLERVERRRGRRPARRRLRRGAGHGRPVHDCAVRPACRAPDPRGTCRRPRRSAARRLRRARGPRSSKRASPDRRPTPRSRWPPGRWRPRHGARLRRRHRLRALAGRVGVRAGPLRRRRALRREVSRSQSFRSSRARSTGGRRTGARSSSPWWARSCSSSGRPTATARDRSRLLRSGARRWPGNLCSATGACTGSASSTWPRSVSRSFSATGS